MASYTLQEGNTYAYVGHYNSDPAEQKYFLKTYYANNQIGSTFTKMWSGQPYNDINEVVQPMVWTETENTSEFDTSKKLSDEYGNQYTFIGRRPTIPPHA